MSEIYPISSERHGSKHLLPLASWAFAANQNLAPLLAAEFPQAAHSFPIVFVKHQEEVAPFALLGLKAGKNLLLDVKNQWLVSYVPAIFRRYPFILAQVDKEKSEYALCIDEASGLLADEGGVALFDEDGNKSEALEKAFNFTAEYQKQLPAGQMFCALLQELELLAPFDINLRENEKTIKLEGLLRIDEQKFNELSDEAFLKLRSAGVLPLVYAHFFSLSKMELLANKLQNSMVPKPVDMSKLPESFKF